VIRLDTLAHAFDLQLGVEVDQVILIHLEAVALRRTVLTHHDDRRLNGRQARQDQVQEDVQVGIDRTRPRVDHHPDGQRDTEADHNGRAYLRDRQKRGVPFDCGTTTQV
jgi:hypothetical protein